MPRSVSRNSITKSATQEDNFTQSSQQSQISQRSLEDHVNKGIIKILSDNFALRSFQKSDLLQGANVKGKTSQNIMEQIKKKIFEVFDLRIEESNNKYILVNPKNKILEHCKSTNPGQILLGIVLTLIVHNNDEITLDEIKSFFTTLSVDTEKYDPYFGNIKKLFHEFEQQLYLEKIIKPRPSEASQIIYKWGLRSKQEVNKKDLIPIIAIMYSVPPEDLSPPLLRLYSDD